MPLPSHQLTRYELDAAWEIHGGILTQALNLVEARILISFDEDPWTDSVVLNHLKAPSLVEIAFEIAETGGPGVFRPFESFIDHSQAATPRKLTLRGCPPPSAITDILLGYLSLTTLRILFRGYLATPYRAANNFLSELTIGAHTSRDDALAPQLSEIYVGCEHKTSIDHAAYLRTLHSLPVHSLKTAELLAHLGAGLDTATVSGLERLRQDGLNLLLLEGYDTKVVMVGWTYAKPY
ncbi:hypothetical protein DFH07DRAFT_1059327 [Mycena maculata]|uniref:Uncharacterized protein n=1 Tax=Mycena maculata TaxID=230809 RepID=A0AAD7JIB3_9AGAR|nr:hypothetical protein DFH07DRAFT_1059327 [Mycena maculata]